MQDILRVEPFVLLGLVVLAGASAQGRHHHLWGSVVQHA